jgi:hypothetical protein
MSSITPAPWTVVEDYGEYQVDGERLPIAVCSVHNPRSEANAYLIAAAPELLDACRKVQAMLTVWNVDPSKSRNTLLSTLMPILTEAIKKARREEKT